MADLRFSGGGHDRRRRLCATDFSSSAESAFDELALDSPADSGSAAFPLLSRDRLIRRFISPRLWKHVVLVSVLLLTPVAIVFGRMMPGGSLASGDQSSRVATILRGLAGLELFLAAQLCLLICWVRSASAVDFRGGYRTWRWMSLLLLFVSLMLVTRAWFTVTDWIAGWLAPVTGSIEAARPALLLVPCAAVTAFVLRSLIPDLRQCRPAQFLAVAGVVLAMGRVMWGLRASVPPPDEALASVDLLIGGLVLSASELFSRYVIHVNPNPPVVAGHRYDAVRRGMDLRETDCFVRTKSSESESESVVVSVRGETEPVAADTPQLPPTGLSAPAPQPEPEPVPVERSETPSSTLRADGGNKASRKKQRRAA